MNNTDIFFSVVVPTYNRSHLILPTLRSVLQQNFDSFELLVIDDGSTDNTKEVVAAEQLKNKRLKYIYQPNSERGFARNNGIQNSAGNYVLFLDSDDLLAPGCLAQLHQLISKQPAYNFYALQYIFKCEDGSVHSFAKLKPGIYTLQHILKGNLFACNFCIKKDNPDLIYFENDRSLATSEDWMFLVENLAKDKILLSNCVGVHMQHHDGRSMQNNQVVIDRKLKATELLQQKVSLSDADLKTLWAYTYAFCATHKYLDFDRKAALGFLKKAVHQKGWNIHFLKIWLRCMMGKRTMNKIKSHLKFI